MTKTVTITNINDIKEFNSLASAVDGDVLVKKGSYCIDGSSLMGLFSLDLSTPIDIVYPAEAVDLNCFLDKFKI